MPLNFLASLLQHLVTSVDVSKLLAHLSNHLFLLEFSTHQSDIDPSVGHCTFAVTMYVLSPDKFKFPSCLH